MTRHFKDMMWMFFNAAVLICLFFAILTTTTGCATQPKQGSTMQKLEEFRTQGQRSWFEGEIGERGNSYHNYKWIVDGTGRVIQGMILVDGKIVMHRLWHYDSFFEWKRKKQHKEMLLEAFAWVREG